MGLKLGTIMVYQCPTCNTFLDVKVETPEAKIERLEAELEKLRLQLAACGVMALCNTPDSYDANLILEDNPAFSDSYQRVCDATRREIELLKENKWLRGEVLAHEANERAVRVIIDKATDAKADLQAEIDRLKRRNRELLEALKALVHEIREYNPSNIDLSPYDAVIAKAKEEK